MFISSNTGRLALLLPQIYFTHHRPSRLSPDLTPVAHILLLMSLSGVSALVALCFSAAALAVDAAASPAQLLAVRGRGNELFALVAGVVVRGIVLIG